MKGRREGRGKRGKGRREKKREGEKRKEGKNGIISDYESCY